MVSATHVVLAFNAAINDRDLQRLADLMSPDHRFADSPGSVVDGKEACVAAWRGFFAYVLGALEHERIATSRLILLLKQRGAS